MLVVKSAVMSAQNDESETRAQGGAASVHDEEKRARRVACLTSLILVCMP
jgi:hypothetical protein